MSASAQTHTTDAMQRFTATGRPYKPRHQQDKHAGTMLAVSVNESLGHGPADLLPRRYDDNSIILVPVIRPEDVGKLEDGGNQKKEKRSLFSGLRSRLPENKKFTIKQMPRGEYLKHYAKDEDGRYAGSEEPAADCILRGDDLAKYRSKDLEYVRERD